MFSNKWSKDPKRRDLLVAGAARDMIEAEYYRARADLAMAYVEHLDNGRMELIEAEIVEAFIMAAEDRQTEPKMKEIHEELGYSHIYYATLVERMPDQTILWKRAKA